MVERQTAFFGSQLGLEATPGTEVPADTKLQSVSFNPGIESESDSFRPDGNLFHTVVAQNRESISGDVDGQPVYDELPYLLSSVLDQGTVTQPDATNAPSVQLWTFDPNSTDANDPATYTVEQGDSNRAHRFAHTLLSGWNLDISRDSLGMGGDFIGHRITDDVVLTAGPATLPLVPVLSNQFDVYVDDTAAGLGTTKITRAFAANFSISDRFNPVWPIDSAQNSFAAFVENADLDATLELTQATDDEGMARLADLRSGDTFFCRLEAVGEVIEDTQTYRLTIDLALKVESPGGYEDEDGVQTIGWTNRLVHDATWGRALKIEVQNTTAAL